MFERAEDETQPGVDFCIWYNLLGGRAHQYELFGLSAREIGEELDLLRLLNRGPLPSHYDDDDYKLSLDAYVADYLKEEVLAEGLARSLPLFSSFLKVAALSDTQVLNFNNVARESAVAASTVRGFYDILVDTLLGEFLPAFVHKPKRRVIKAPKFYFRDVGVVNHLAKRVDIQTGSPLIGSAFENWVFHELSLHKKYTQSNRELSYWNPVEGSEVDFVLGDAEIAIEAKAKTRITKSDLAGLKQFKKDYPMVSQTIIVCLEEVPRKTDSGIRILPYKQFLTELWEDGGFSASH